LKYLEGKQV